MHLRYSRTCADTAYCKCEISHNQALASFEESIDDKKPKEDDDDGKDGRNSRICGIIIQLDSFFTVSKDDSAVADEVHAPYRDETE